MDCGDSFDVAPALGLFEVGWGGLVVVLPPGQSPSPCACLSHSPVQEVEISLDEQNAHLSR